MSITEGIVAGILLAGLVALSGQAAESISDALDKAAPGGVPNQACVEEALDRHGVLVTDELNAAASGGSTSASADILACVAPKIPAWLTEALQ